MNIIQEAKDEIKAKKKLEKYNKKEKHMKNINWKIVVEKTKTITLIIIFTAAIAFYAGIKYQIRQDSHVNQKVNEAVKSVVTKNTERALQHCIQ